MAYQITGSRKRFIPAIVLLFGLGLATAATAQTAKPSGKTVAAKPVSFLVKFGPYKDKMPIVLSDLKVALNTDLKVTDSATGQAYEIISFRFGWRKKESSDDYKTGKKKIITSFNAVEVYNNSRIPEGWQAELKESAKASDELLFEDIYVQNPVTKKMYQAPSISFKVL
ncbi:MAG TPA: hypothetical protein VLC98_01010 [Phnomibacter sp.]|nr:hypothetical protein [Phnomibacter sp.]